MRPLKSNNFGEKCVFADVGEVEYLVCYGLVGAEAGVILATLEDRRQHDVDL